MEKNGRRKVKEFKTKKKYIIGIFNIIHYRFILFATISIMEVCNLESDNRISTKATIYDVTYDYDITLEQKQILNMKLMERYIKTNFFIFPIYRIGSEVNIYYNKDNPEECGTYEGVSLFLSIIGAIIILNLYINMKIKKIEKQKEIIFLNRENFKK